MTLAEAERPQSLPGLTSATGSPTTMWEAGRPGKPLFANRFVVDDAMCSRFGMAGAILQAFLHVAVRIQPLLQVGAPRCCRFVALGSQSACLSPRAWGVGSLEVPIGRRVFYMLVGVLKASSPRKNGPSPYLDFRQPRSCRKRHQECLFKRASARFQSHGAHSPRQSTQVRACVLSVACVRASRHGVRRHV